MVYIKTDCQAVESTIHHQFGGKVNGGGPVDCHTSVVASVMIPDNINGQRADLLSQLNHGYIVYVLIDLTSIEEPRKANREVTRGDQALNTSRFTKVRGLISEIEWGNFRSHLSRVFFGG